MVVFFLMAGIICVLFPEVSLFFLSANELASKTGFRYSSISLEILMGEPEMKQMVFLVVLLSSSLACARIITLEWDEVTQDVENNTEQIGHYVVGVGTVSGTYPHTYPTTGALTSLAINDPVLNNNQAYYLAVKAVDLANNESDWSGEVVVDPEECGNGTDDDSDTLVDCNDPDCGPAPVCGVGVCASAHKQCVSNVWADCSAGQMGSDYEAQEASCDGKDNDCDGTTDEVDDMTNPLCESQQGVCAGSTATCSSGAWQACDETNYGSDYDKDKDTCGDGKDNDCDGSTDEGCECTNGQQQQCGKNQGVCAGVMQTCTDNVWPPCDFGPDFQESETACDGKDNDCNGTTDVNLPPVPCEKTLGLCAGKHKRCSSGAWQDCTASDYGVGYEGTETACDQVDNDCDGETDEGCECTTGQSQVCGVGVCSSVTQTCENGHWSTCQYGADYEETESRCDGRDNDCDGQTDDDDVDLSCECIDGNQQRCGSSLGVCLSAGQTCASGLWGDCIFPPNHESDESTCDNLDNDCDGAIDEGCQCQGAGSRDCGPGVCAGRQQICTDGTWGSCDLPSTYQVIETRCDQLDNDCDGQIDEDDVCSSHDSPLFIEGGCSCGSGSDSGAGGLLLLLPILVLLRRRGR
jgi:hypothetical protein